MTKQVAWVVDSDKDNVATILSNEIKEDMSIDVKLRNDVISITVNSDIPYGHKVAIRPIKKGETVFKYGLSIGRATEDINVGDHVHVHNIESNRGRGDLFKDAKGEAASV